MSGIPPWRVGIVRMMLALLSAGAFQLANAAGPTVHTVAMEGVKFEPETVTVARGDTVVWVNKDPFPHTATAKGAFDSKEIAAGKSWRFVTRGAGTYVYVCTLHPGMKGTLVVQ